jgi:cellulose biosynthesis protein BcsQ
MGLDLFFKLVEAVKKLLTTNDWEAIATVIVVSAVLGGSIAAGIRYIIRLLRPPLPGGELQIKLTKVISDLEIANGKLENLNRLTAALEQPDDELWHFHSATVPRELQDRIRASGIKVITLANLKGGVGKTTVAANLGAYFHAQGLSVLMIDFDYQGSLSATVLRAAGRTEVPGITDRILAGTLTATEVADPGQFLAPNLAKMRILPAGYALNRQESRTLTRWLLKLDEQDPRFALLRLLSDQNIINKFNVVIIDTPPRLTMATVNALCASTHFVVPTILDKLSIENVGDFLKQVDTWFRKELNPGIELVGIVSTMTDTNLVTRPGNDLTKLEDDAHERLNRAVLENWGVGNYLLKAMVPSTARFKQDAGQTIAFLDERQLNHVTRQIVTNLGEELSERLKK